MRGFLVLSDIAELCCKCDDFYHLNNGGGMAWNVPELGIKWLGVNGNIRERRTQKVTV
ncbi:dTDP-4-dehydrorhamnose 3,5-epimerase family protein [Blautia hydrogenotrophica]|uniref:dTDP-4-dehydrorhamnose 3,5-epimerase family protein n=1 Tax=Blautia hydrogenotrophica TaxID=53443 RepID=UPI003AB55BAE